jgi:signal transduction histidine kinase
MIPNSAPHRYFWLILLALLVACTPAQPNETEVFSTAIAIAQTGIPPEETAKIFEELYRGVNARGREGSGLGLALAHRIVVLHGA